MTTGMSSWLTSRTGFLPSKYSIEAPHIDVCDVCMYVHSGWALNPRDCLVS